MLTASSAGGSARRSRVWVFGYTRVRGYHPLLASRADTGEVLHVRLRKGSANTSRGIASILDELIACVNHAWRDRPETAARRFGILVVYNGRRLITRRVQTQDRQGQLLPNWEHFSFLTNRTDELSLVEAEHRDHAVVEQAICGLKDQALAHFPSGQHCANAAWTVIGALAQNLSRWTQTIALPNSTIRTARTR